MKHVSRVLSVCILSVLAAILLVLFLAPRLFETQQAPQELPSVYQPETLCYYITLSGEDLVVYRGGPSGSLMERIPADMAGLPGDVIARLEEGVTLKGRLELMHWIEDCAA